VTAHALVLLGKPGCHLCEEMRAVAEPVARALGLPFDERDVRSDPELDALYGLDIPVLLLGGREVARHHVDAATLRIRLGPLASA
jgi:glutaredoxin-like protein DUF836